MTTTTTRARTAGCAERRGLRLRRWRARYTLSLSFLPSFLPSDSLVRCVSTTRLVLPRSLLFAFRSPPSPCSLPLLRSPNPPPLRGLAASRSRALCGVSPCNVSVHSKAASDRPSGPDGSARPGSGARPARRESLLSRSLASLALRSPRFRGLYSSRTKSGVRMRASRRCARPATTALPCVHSGRTGLPASRSARSSSRLSSPSSARSHVFRVRSQRFADLGPPPPSPLQRSRPLAAATTYGHDTR